MHINLANILLDAGHRFVTGVPDSSLKSLCFEFAQRDDFCHIHATSEGGAVSLGIGNWIATAKRPVVYMQNSGLANGLNPLLSLASSAAFNMPMTLIIGWRGKPGYADEPQHRLVGKHTEQMLSMAEFKTIRLDKPIDNYVHKQIHETLLQHKRVAILVQPGVDVSSYDQEPKSYLDQPRIKKTDLLSMLLSLSKEDYILVGGIGHTSRQLMKLRAELDDNAFVDFHCVGGMGYASSISAGIASAQIKKHVVCLDGDGAFLMHGTNAAAYASTKGLYLTHIVMDNGTHASVGGHTVTTSVVDYEKIALGLGYPIVVQASSIKEIELALETSPKFTHPKFILVRVDDGDTHQLPRPSLSLRETVKEFQALHFKH